MKTRIRLFIHSIPRLSGLVPIPLLLGFVLWLGSLTYTAAQDISWQKALGGAKNDSITAVLATADGGYVVAGSTTSNDGDVSGNHGGQDAWIVKLNSAGAIVWKKTIGGTGDDQATAITASPDGGYVVTGNTTSIDGDMSGFNPFIRIYLWVFKLNSTGEIVWKQYKDEARGLYATSIVTTPDGGYLVAGYNFNRGLKPTARLFAVLKLSDSGTISWAHYFGGTFGDDLLYAITASPDGGCVVVGRSSSYDIQSATVSTGNDHSKNHTQFSTYDVWVSKLNSEGNLTWYKFFGGNGQDYANDVKATPDGGYVVAGYTESADGPYGDVRGVYHGNGDAWILKLSGTGDLLWQKTLGGSGTDNAYAVTTTTDGAYLVAGTTNSNDGDVTGNHGASDAWLVKLTSAGELIWQKPYGGTGADEGKAIITMPDGSYVVAGSTTSSDGDVSGNHGGQDAWLLKVGAPKPPLREPLTVRPSYQCAIGQLVLNTVGGDGSLIEYKVPGLGDWRTSPEFFVPTYQRDGMIFTLYFRQSGKEFTTQYTTVCDLTNPQKLVILAPAYQCSTGRLVLNTVGGNGTLIEYKVPGLGDWRTSPEFFVPTYQRDGMAFTLYFRQSGQEFTTQYTTICDLTTSQKLVATTPTYQCSTGRLVLNTAGGDGTLVEYKIPGLGDWCTSPEFFVPTYQRDGMIFTLYIRQSGQEFTTQYTTACDLTNPQKLVITDPSYQCSIGRLVLNTVDGDGTLIEYKIPGLGDWRTSPEFFVPTYQRDGMLFTIYVRQSGHEYITQYTTRCTGSARQAASETMEAEKLQVRLIGNPVVNQEVIAEVTGVYGKPLAVKLTDSRGRVLEQQQIEKAQLTERLTLRLPTESASIFLLEVATPSQHKTVRVLVK